MNSRNTAELRQWVETWRAADRALALAKVAELERIETCAAVLQLTDAFNAAVRVAESAPTGLVEQQRVFQRLRG